MVDEFGAAYPNTVDREEDGDKGGDTCPNKEIFNARV